MTATRQDIRDWIAEGIEKGATHVIIMCDTFDHENYPSYIMPGEDPKEKRSFENMQRPDECYDLRMDIDAQLNEDRANHWDM